MNAFRGERQNPVKSNFQTSVTVGGATPRHRAAATMRQTLELSRMNKFSRFGFLTFRNSALTAKSESSFSVRTACFARMTFVEGTLRLFRPTS